MRKEMTTDVIDDVDVLMMINVVHDYLKDNYRIFDDCK